MLKCSTQVGYLHTFIAMFILNFDIRNPVATIGGKSGHMLTAKGNATIEFC